MIQIEAWSDFLLRTYPPRIQSELFYPVSADHSMDERINLAELNKSIENTKSGKAPGVDLISANFFKFLPEDWRLLLLDLLNKVLDGGWFRNHGLR